MIRRLMAPGRDSGSGLQHPDASGAAGHEGSPAIWIRFDQGPVAVGGDVLDCGRLLWNGRGAALFWS